MGLVGCEDPCHYVTAILDRQPGRPKPIEETRIPKRPGRQILSCVMCPGTACHAEHNKVSR
jgi:hypothetical protein